MNDSLSMTAISTLCWSRNSERWALSDYSWANFVRNRWIELSHQYGMIDRIILFVMFFFNYKQKPMTIPQTMSSTQPTADATKWMAIHYASDSPIRVHTECGKKTTTHQFRAATSSLRLAGNRSRHSVRIRCKRHNGPQTQTMRAIAINVP